MPMLAEHDRGERRGEDGHVEPGRPRGMVAGARVLDLLVDRRAEEPESGTAAVSLLIRAGRSESTDDVGDEDGGEQQHCRDRARSEPSTSATVTPVIASATPPFSKQPVPVDAHVTGDERAQPEQGGEVEDVGADDDADADRSRGWRRGP